MRFVCAGLGVLHWHGQGGEVNLTAAHECFLKGAAHNHSDSLYNLALMEANGIGVAKVCGGAGRGRDVWLQPVPDKQCHLRCTVAGQCWHEVNGPACPPCCATLTHRMSLLASCTTNWLTTMATGRQPSTLPSCMRMGWALTRWGCKLVQGTWPWAGLATPQLTADFSLSTRSNVRHA